MLCIVGRSADHARAALAAVYIYYTYALLMDERWASAVTGTLNRSSSAAEVLVNGAQAEREVR
jgi:hypothetical protein